ncbi:MAG: ATP-binding protein [Pelistega sp.]|nr:ATP-binding protein [Pelistega sp.]
MKASTSIQRRLFTYLSSALLALWLAIAIGSSWGAFKEINEIADSQMLQSAYLIQQVSPNVQHFHILDDIEDILDENTGNADMGDLGFAVWDKQGQLLLADQKGQYFPHSTQEGFHSEAYLWNIDSWRYVYLINSDRTVVVGQKMEERFEMLFNALWVQLSLILFSIPILLVLIIYGVRRGLSPLKTLTQELQARGANSLQTVSEDVPYETKPLVRELNHLLNRLEQSIQKERRFTSDAAHELRSPLAALKVQAEVLAMSEDKEEQLHHLAHMQASIERANRLTEQLLILSRLDPMQGIPDSQAINWTTLIPQVLQSVNLTAREKRIRLKLDCAIGLDKALPLEGNPLLIQTMLRNMLDNAIRYSPEQTEVTLSLSATQISVQDQGPGIAPEDMSRIKERFYRPAGQTQQGSGLGFSIIESIAKLHQLNLQLLNQPHQGLNVVLNRMPR